jgi:capsular exopolysaccharide synthesis family protein
LFTDPQENSFFTEAYRMLITDINYLLSNKPGKEAQVLFFTSSIKGEGKTYNALNTALAYVSMGKKVMLIGADLRNPQLHNYLDCPKDQKGFSDYLHDHSLSVRDCVSKSYDQTKFALDIVFSGAIPPNPGLLLDNGRLESFISEIEVEYDYLIFDAAPVVLVNDSLLITKYADLVVYLTKAGHTEKELLEVPKRLLKQNKVKNLAVLINGIGESSDKGYGYGYGYGYNYGYGYGYGAKQSKKRWWQSGNNS